MLGQPMSMLIPQVLGVQPARRAARGRDRDRPRADGHRDAARARRGRHVRRVLRRRPRRPAARRPRDDRQHVARVRLDLRDLPDRRRDARATCELSGRPPRADRARRGLRQGAGAVARRAAPRSRRFSDTIELDLGDRRAEPRRAQAPAGPRLAERGAGAPSGARSRTTCPSDGEQADAHDEAVAESYPASDPPANGAPGPRAAPSAQRAASCPPAARRRSPHNGTGARRVTLDGESFELDHGHVVIAAITSCTNTSNPSVMVGAGILARNAVARGLRAQAVGEDLARAGLEGRHRVPRPRRPDRAARAARLQPRRLRLHDVHRQLRAAAARRSPRRSARRDLAVVSVLSGNRNFEGRINPDVKMNYLASPPLCVAYALAGTMDIDIVARPARPGRAGRGRLPARHLAVRAGGRRRRSARRCAPDMFRKSYGEVFAGDERWNGARGPRRASASPGTRTRPTCACRPTSRTCPPSPAPVTRHRRARACSRCSATASPPTTSRPAGAIKRDGPAGAYLQEHGVEPRDFNSYGSRRGNHEVMMRGTFANIRLRNQLGGGPRRCPKAASRATSATATAPSRCRSTTPRCATSQEGIAAGRARRQGVRLGLLARLGGEGHAAARRARGDRRELRAHPPLQPRRHGRAAAAVPRRARAPQSLGLTGEETFSIDGLAEAMADGGAPPREVQRDARRATAPSRSSSTRACASTRRARPTTSATAASSSTSCARCSPHEPAARRDASGAARAGVPPLLLDLLAARGPSGYESAAARRCGARRPARSREVEHRRASARRSRASRRAHGATQRRRGGCS